MISYSELNYVEKFSAEALEKTRNLPLYGDGPGVDYTKALHAYALNATLVCDLKRTPEEVMEDGPSDAAEVLLVERASGHGVIGSFSGVSGYIDTLKDPSDAEARFDPIAYTLRQEFTEECGFTDKEFGSVGFYAGTPTVEARTITPGAKITVVPILGVCRERPEITINPRELASYRWVGLTAIKAAERLARGYREITLPSALGAIGLKTEAIARLLA